jgi:hypothetical protein
MLARKGRSPCPQGSSILPQELFRRPGGEAFGVARQARKVTDEAWEVISGIPESIPLFTDWSLGLAVKIIPADKPKSGHAR